MRTFLVLLLLLVAGCASSPRSSGPATGAAVTDDVTARFSAPTLVGTGAAIETDLRVKGDTMLACSHGRFAHPSPVWSSLDDGRSWQPQPAHPGQQTGDCDVAITADGAWYAVFDTNDGPSGPTELIDPGRTTLAVSTDRGASWSTTVVPVANPPQSDRPWLAPVGNAILVVGGDLMLGNYPGETTAALSRDHGATWSVSVVAKPDPKFPHHIRGPLVVSPDGTTIRVPLAFIDLYADASVTRYQFAASRDGGASWSIEPVADVKGGSVTPLAAQAGDGTLYWMFAQNQTAGFQAIPDATLKPGPSTWSADVNVLASHDDGKTWSAPLLVAPHQEGAVFGGWIDGAPDGGATLAWTTTNGTGDKAVNHVVVARIAPGPAVAWAGPAIAPVTGDNPEDWGPSVRYDAHGKAIVAYPMIGDACEGPDRTTQCAWIVRER